MRRLAIIGLFLLASAGVAQAQMQSTFLSCSQFKQNKDGTWRAKGWVILPCGIQITSATPFGEGLNLCGRDLAAELDEACTQ